MAAGDSVGATPPISTFFERHADDRDHEHDGDRHRRPRQPQLRPRRRLPAADADPAGELSRSSRRTSSTRTARRRPSGRRRTSSSSGTTCRSAIVGFSNDDIPTLTKPGALDPFHVARLDGPPSTPRRRSIAKKTDAIVAIGHLGATAGTLTAPTGPLVDLADNVVERRRRDRRPHRPAGRLRPGRTACS